MRKLALAACLLGGLAANACAPKTVPAPIVTAPRFPEFIRPGVPDAFAASRATENESRGWALLQTGDLKAAEREFAAALKITPAFYPAETSLGYVELGRQDPKAALAHFDRALELDRQLREPSTHVGRGEALLAIGRDADAIVAFEAAVGADPSLGDLRRRVEVLKFRSVEQGLAYGRDAARAGRVDEAIRAYTAAIASSPDSPFLYREIAAVERRRGDLDAALEHFHRAVTLDPADANSLAQIGEILESRSDFESAAKAYGDSLAIEPSPEVEKRLEDVRARAALARLPAEYRAIEQAAQITRADLAALIGIRLGALLQGGGRSDAALITDVRNHWAATWIVAVARAGVMEPFANHAFQPLSVVRRIDLAQAAAGLLARIAVQNPARGNAWESARLNFRDLAASHLAYPAASAAVAAGVMTTSGGDNAFQPSRPVTGAEATDAIAKLEALAGRK